MIMTEKSFISTLSDPSLSIGVPDSPPATEQAGQPDGVFRCLCGFSHDDGRSIQCDNCYHWEHFECAQIQGELPETYTCFTCKPRDLDVDRAKQYQLQVRKNAGFEDPEIKIPTHKKKPASRNHRKKEPGSGASSGSSKTANGTEKSGSTKLPSPKEGNPPNRKRHRGTQNHLFAPTGIPGPGTPGGPTASPSPGATGYFDRNDDSDADNYRKEFNYISKCTFEEPELQRCLIKSLSSASPDEGKTVQRYTTSEFEALAFPKTSVKPITNQSKSFPLHSPRSLVLEDACPKGTLVTVYNGKVSYQHRFKAVSVNRYNVSRHPPVYVLFAPDVCIDARHQGNDARYARRSCRPNLSVSPILLDDARVEFGLFAMDNLKPGSELTLGWDWDGSPEMKQLAESGFDSQALGLEQLKQAADWVVNIVTDMGDCACVGGMDCMLSKVKKWAGVGKSGNGSKSNCNSSGHKSRKSISFSGRTVEAASSENTSRRSASAGSREITPVSTSDMDGISRREQKKLQDQVRQIDKAVDQPLQQTKRRRGNTVGEGHVAADGTKKYKSSSTQKDRSPSLSTIGLDAAKDQKERRRRKMSTCSDIKVKKAKIPTKSRSASTSTVASPGYVDMAIQTEEADDLPWWKQPISTIAPRPPKIPIRKRLLQDLLLRQRGEVSPAPEKKRKRDATPDDSCGLKVLKTSGEESVRLNSPISPDTGSREPPSDTQSAIPTIQVHNTSTSDRPRGPALTELFDENPKDVPGKVAAVAAVSVKADPSDAPSTNGRGANGLRVVMPTAGVRNGLPTPSDSDPATAKALTPSPTTPASVPATKVKKVTKFSLGEYTNKKRQKRASSTVDGEAAAAAVAKATSPGPAGSPAPLDSKESSKSWIPRVTEFPTQPPTQPTTAPSLAPAAVIEQKLSTAAAKTQPPWGDVR